jgi:hypothetical protein
MRRVRLLALACITGAVLGAAGADAAQATTYLPGRCYDLIVKPKRVILACGDGGLFLSAMHWTEWGKPRAHGNGRMLANDCDPSCVDGTFIGYPVRVTLSGRSAAAATPSSTRGCTTASPRTVRSRPTRPAR